jgi:hypothetical protein
MLDALRRVKVVRNIAPYKLRVKSKLSVNSLIESFDCRHFFSLEKASYGGFPDSKNMPYPDLQQ